MCACACACVCTCVVYACMCMCVYVCVYVCVLCMCVSDSTHCNAYLTHACCVLNIAFVMQNNDINYCMSSYPLLYTEF